MEHKWDSQGQYQRCWFKHSHVLQGILSSVRSWTCVSRSVRRGWLTHNLLSEQVKATLCYSWLFQCCRHRDTIHYTTTTLRRTQHISTICFCLTKFFWRRSGVRMEERREIQRKKVLLKVSVSNQCNNLCFMYILTVHNIYEVLGRKPLQWHIMYHSLKSLHRANSILQVDHACYTGIGTVIKNLNLPTGCASKNINRLLTCSVHSCKIKFGVGRTRWSRSMTCQKSIIECKRFWFNPVKADNVASNTIAINRVWVVLVAKTSNIWKSVAARCQTVLAVKC